MDKKTDHNDLKASDDVSRRGFLKLAGFGIGGAALAGCQQAPVEHAIPYLMQPEELIPGRALFYATTCQACPAACGMLAKTVDGRPIKLEGNPQHPLSRGGLCAVGQASLLGLYDNLRLSRPLKEGRQTSWQDADSELRRRLEQIRSRGGAVRLLAPTIVSPTLRRVVERFLDSFEDGRLVEFDLLSSAAILEAHQRTHGVGVLPRYRFDRAAVIVGFDADFLGSWISPVEFAAGYRQGRQLEAESGGFSFHAQFEARMSLTGANADQRIPIAPGSLAPALAHLVHLLAPRAGWTETPAPQAGTDEPDPSLFGQLADRLWQNRGKSLVVCGAQDLESQILCNALNEMLGNYGSTVDIQAPSRQLQGSDRNLLVLAQELKEGAVEALLIAGMNPVHSLPLGPELGEDISKLELVVDFAERPDETSRLATFVCPLPHNLESWSDAQPVDGLVSLCQPAIRPLGEARPLMEVLEGWTGGSRSSLELLKDHWQEDIFPRASTELSFQDFWDQSLHDGFARLDREAAPTPAFERDSISSLPSPAAPAGEALVLIAYPKVGMLDGRPAYNAWNHELPDPISKVTWGNYACISPAAADRLGVREGDVVRLSTSQGEVELPALLQPGQHDRVVAVALGYGAQASERFAQLGPQWIEAQPSVQEDGRVGKNAAPLLTFEGGFLQLSGQPVEVARTGGFLALACTQDHHEVEVPEHLRAGNRKTRPI
ncbi:MAG: molybdopterin dinucleotide binding domain-containing protein, partial [Acidobacteriota bacterium]